MTKEKMEEAKAEICLTLPTLAQFACTAEGKLHFATLLNIWKHTLFSSLPSKLLISFIQTEVCTSLSGTQSL